METLPARCRRYSFPNRRPSEFFGLSGAARVDQELENLREILRGK